VPKKSRYQAFQPEQRVGVEGYFDAVSESFNKSKETNQAVFDEPAGRELSGRQHL